MKWGIWAKNLQDGHLEREGKRLKRQQAKALWIFNVGKEQKLNKMTISLTRSHAVSVCWYSHMAQKRGNRRLQRG